MSCLSYVSRFREKKENEVSFNKRLQLIHDELLDFVVDYDPEPCCQGIRKVKMIQKIEEVFS